MTAIFTLQLVTLGLVGAILCALLLLAFWDSRRTRAAEQFLLGGAFGLTLGVVIATLLHISNLS